ncbi:MAG TPA: 4Fe-4S dicluster domain-containing protein, partial [Bacillota bacterium]|nr:4Fe-4S dicluster domain-containing protein [Bacillota bacterium]
WCGKLCPRGSFFQYLWGPLSRKITGGTGKIPHWLRNSATRWTLFTGLMGVLAFRMLRAWGDWAAMGGILLSVIILTTIIGMVLAMLYHPRAWCAVCPMGTLASAVGKGRQNLQVSESCVNCKLCTKSCPSQLSIGEFREKGEIVHGDCMKCEECVAVCKKGAISTKGSGCGFVA